MAIANDPSTAYSNPAGLAQLSTTTFYWASKNEIIFLFGSLQKKLGIRGSFGFMYTAPSEYIYAIYSRDTHDFTPPTPTVYNKAIKYGQWDQTIISYLTLPIGIEISKSFDFGINLGLVSKRRRIAIESVIKQIVTNDGYTYDGNFILRESGEETGSNFAIDFGCIYNINELFKLGFRYWPKTEISWKTLKHEAMPIESTEWLDNSGKDIIPSKTGLGIAYIKDGITISADLMLYKWSEAKRIGDVTIVDAGLFDVIETGIGVEYYILNNKLPLRFGIFDKPDYTRKDIVNTNERFVTYGTGFQMKHLGFDIAYLDSKILNNSEDKSETLFSLSWKF